MFSIELELKQVDALSPLLLNLSLEKAVQNEARVLNVDKYYMKVLGDLNILKATNALYHTAGRIGL